MNSKIFRNQKVAVLGFEINGFDSVEFLLKQKAQITVYDKKNNTDIDLKGYDKKGVKFILGPDYLKDGLTNYTYVFRSPAVYPYLPEIVESQNKGVIVTSPLKVFFDLCPGTIIGVTGTKGKGTTSTLIYEMLRATGMDTFLAGNIGKPVLGLLPYLTKKSVVVLELSSFQLMDLTKSPHIAVVLNITTDHMDWHKNRKEYVEAKTQIARHQGKKDFAVLNFDYKDSKSFEKLTKAHKLYFSRTKVVEGCYVKNRSIILDIGDNKIVIGETGKLLLRGEHNWENVCASCLGAYLAGASIDSIKQTVFSFKGLEHRLELVGTVKGINFYNDSFSTNPQTTIAAIKSFSEPMTLILGGSDKGLNYDELGMVISNTKNINAVVLIGFISDIIKKSLLKYNFNGNLIELGSLDIKEVISKCIEYTPYGGVVVLSPATASFDMFKDYKDRGNQFKEAVKRLPLS